MLPFSTFFGNPQIYAMLKQIERFEFNNAAVVDDAEDIQISMRQMNQLYNPVKSVLAKRDGIYYLE